MKHTPTPWMQLHGRWVIPTKHADRKIGGSTNKTQDRDDYAACICITGDNPNRFKDGEPEANAVFIVHAVNSHEKLKNALKLALKMIEDEVADGKFTEQAALAREALDAAGEQS